MSDEKIEQMIKEKGLDAPRVTPQLIEVKIVSCIFFSAEEGRLGAYKNNNDVYRGTTPSDKDIVPLSLLTFCVLTLENGFTVTGESACASPENFDAEVGREAALNNAKSKIRALGGYLLREKLYQGTLTDPA